MMHLINCPEITNQNPQSPFEGTAGITIIVIYDIMANYVSDGLFFLKNHAASQITAIVTAEPATPAKLVQPGEIFVSCWAAFADTGVLIE